MLSLKKRRKNIESQEQQKQEIIQLLSQKDHMVLATALMYAENFIKYGVNVAKQWETATEQSEALERAFIHGRTKEREVLKDYCNKCALSKKENEKDERT